MTDLGLLIYFIIGTIMSVVSGIAGGGGGFITTPLMVFLGLSPAQAVITGKLGGVMMSLGSLTGLKGGEGNLSKRKVMPVMLLALIVGTIAPYIVKSLDAQVYRITIGLLILLMIPVLLKKEIGLRSYKPTTNNKIIGSILLCVSLLLQGVFSGGLGTLVNIVLMGFLGMTAIEANITKRWSQLILNLTMIIGVLTSGLIVWKVAIVGLISAFIGGYLGGRIAIKKGDKLVMNVMLGLMFVSGVWLMFGS